MDENMTLAAQLEEKSKDEAGSSSGSLLPVILVDD